MKRLLSDHPSWKGANQPTTDHATPIPTFNPEAIEQFRLQRIQAQQAQVGYYTFKHIPQTPLPGIDACICAIHACIRIHNILPIQLQISEKCKEEVVRDMPRFFGRHFTDFIPYISSDGAMHASGEIMIYIQKIPVVVKNNIPIDTIQCILF